MQTGAFNETFVEIVSGLQVDEKVLLSPPRPVERENAYESKQLKQSSPEEKQPQDGVEKDSKTNEEPKPDSGVSTTS